MAILEKLNEIAEAKASIADVIQNKFGMNIPKFSEFGTALNEYANTMENKINGVSAVLTSNIPDSNACYNVFVFGDSTLGYSVSSNMNRYSTVLSAEIAARDDEQRLCSVFRIGQTGDRIHNVMYNAGAHPVYLKPFTLPGDGTEVEVSCESDNGWIYTHATKGSFNGPDIICNIVAAAPSHDPGDLDVTIKKSPMSTDEKSSYGYLMNPIFLDGIKCHIRRVNGEGELSSNYDASKLLVRRLDPSAESYTFDYPTQIHTAFETQHTVNDVVVFFIGTNTEVWPPSSPSANDTLVNGLKQIISSMKSSKYIVVGNHVRGNAKDGRYSDLNCRLGLEFGQHFTNFLSLANSYGFGIANIEPTDADAAAVEAGTIPPSFMKDNVHLNDIGYKVLGKIIYMKGRELGYWK